MCLGGEQVEFRATPEQSCGTDLCRVWTQGHFRAAENSFGSNQWFEADFGEFLVTRLCKVEVQIKRKYDAWCGGTSWDYAELRPVDWLKDNSQTTIP